jgi:hypothetical protein
MYSGLKMKREFVKTGKSGFEYYFAEIHSDDLSDNLKVPQDWDFESIGIYLFVRFMLSHTDDQNHYVAYPNGILKSDELKSIDDLKRFKSLRIGNSSNSVFFLSCTDQAEVDTKMLDLNIENLVQWENTIFSAEELSQRKKEKI